MGRSPLLHCRCFQKQAPSTSRSTIGMCPCDEYERYVYSRRIIQPAAQRSLVPRRARIGMTGADESKYSLCGTRLSCRQIKKSRGSHSDSDFFHLNLSPNRQITRPKKVEPVIPILNLRGTKEREAAG